MKLLKKKIIKGTITALTGIHIGAGKDTLEVGGVDNAVIKNPRTGEPYIPGSTLKGKMRSLLERVKGKMNLQIGKDKDKIELDKLKEKLKDGSTTFQANACNCGRCDICEVFGVGVNDQQLDNPIPIRLIVRDAYLTEESKKELEITTDGLLTEVKPEVSLDRITSKPPHGPRQIERISEGSKFNFEFVLNVYSGDNEDTYIKLIKEALELVEDDYIGGSGTRGSGQVKFEYEIKEKSLMS